MLRACSMAVALLAASACGEGGRSMAQGSTTPQTSSGNTPIVRYVPREDAAMNAAIARARATLPHFLPRLQNPRAGQSYLGVKVRLGDKSAGEHIWLYEVRYQAGRIVGRLVDDAELFPKFRRDDEVRVAPGEISDWMTVENGLACGGFTSRIMALSMTPEQRAAWMREMGIARLPPGDTVCDQGTGR
jgi:uncharacterized protein YegJ (DUF2314 family)